MIMGGSSRERGRTMGLFGRKDQMPKLVYCLGEWHETAAFIGERWIQTAAVAWEGYQAAGRGFVRLDEDATLIYVAAASPGILASRERITHSVRRECARYDPERELVVVAVGARDEKALRAGKVGHVWGVVTPRMGGSSLTPPEAYQVVLAVERERQR
jgi:hypothetical protein